MLSHPSESAAKTTNYLDTNMINLEKFQKDLSVDEQGIGFMSRCALARMCGVHLRSIQKLLKRCEQGDDQILPKTLEPLAGQSFEGDAQLSDITCSAILKYYAYQGREKPNNGICISQLLEYEHLFTTLVGISLSDD